MSSNSKICEKAILFSITNSVYSDGSRRLINPNMELTFGFPRLRLKMEGIVKLLCQVSAKWVLLCSLKCLPYFFTPKIAWWLLRHRVSAWEGTKKNVGKEIGESILFPKNPVINDVNWPIRVTILSSNLVLTLALIIISVLIIPTF